MTNNVASPGPSQRTDELWGHPKGLYVLFFTELWERFSYYGMRAILVLFLVAKVKEDAHGGLGWTRQEALALYGWYTMLVYVASIPGGWLADRVFGQKKAVMYGGLLLCVGHGIMAIHGMAFFYSALALIILGVGLLKPNISTMVGGLYATGDARRDKGFTIFYIGINLGALGAGLIVGAIGETIGWHYGFGLAGIGMLVGQAVYGWGQRYLTDVGNVPQLAGNSGAAAKADAPLTAIEKDRVKVLVLSFLIVIVFWGAFEQAGGLMNLYTKDKVNRMAGGWEVPASVFQSLNPLFIILFGTLVANFWYRRAERSKEASSLFKMAVGTMIMGTGFLFMVGAAQEAGVDGKAGMYWLFAAYLFHTIGELCASPVALSFITKLAPAKYASLMMGVYFATTGFGNKIAGLLGEAASEAGELAIFGGIFGFTFVFGALILALLKPLNRLTHNAEQFQTDGGH
ncbi:MAG: peptide MFS transporter [Myxococcales bacterium]|nr:peptide MFS transporter [Myxococcales bacterium]